jgi:hypothetical protein
MHEVKEKEKVKKNVSGFKHLRSKLISDSMPEISMEIGYKNKENGDITLISSDTAPLRRFPASKYTKTHEICTVPVGIFSH